MAFRLWRSCPHPVAITPDGTWHRPECKLVRGFNPNDVMHLAPDEPLALEQAPRRCGRCYPDIRITGGPT